MRRFLDRLYAASGALAAVCLAAICVMLLAQALGREARVLVRVGLWIDKLGARARWLAELFALAVTAVFVSYMLWAVARFVYESWQFNEMAQGLIRIPIWIPQLSFVLGAAIFLVAVLDELVAVLKKHKPAYQVAEEARRAAGDYSETV